MVPEENTKTSLDTQNHTTLSSWQQEQSYDYWNDDMSSYQVQTKKKASISHSTPLRNMASSTSSSSDTEKQVQFLRDMEKARKQLALFRREMNGLATQINGISDDLYDSRNRVHEIEQDLTETQEDNVNLQVLLERAVKSQKESDVFAIQAIRNIHSDLDLVVRENNQLQERLSSIEFIQMEHKGNVHDVVARMREYVYMLEQAQDAIQLMHEPTTKQQTPILHDIDSHSVSVQDFGLDSRRTSETSSYMTEDEDIGISIRKESQTTLDHHHHQRQQQQLTIPSSHIISHPRIVHKRASFPAFLPSPVLGPKNDTKFMQSQHYKQPNLHPDHTHHQHSQPQTQTQKQRKLKKPTSQPGLLLLLSD
ncbi:hypothetical protein BCR42DRAFT_427665 [Absidia repens]|uniref:Uncharacterized protein n=1 Tax=Absidia repens TaxID=90262 RepID=A0A1X2HZJ1_9FUNG|nr:hypothetical protein BCR42DRAFT_427665 [Absidia repens]